MATTRPKVLVAPLGWGLGHATRCIPVIRELLRQGAEVLIADHGDGKIILQHTFPALQFIDLPYFNVRYPARIPLAAAMLMQLPVLWKSVKREHRALDKLIDDVQITHVVSDNRFGLYSQKIPCTFMTHQVHISGGRGMKMFEPALFRMNRFWIEKFRLLWIPDVPPPGQIAGELSNAKDIRISYKYVGLLSRFEKRIIPATKKYDVVAILSGPEPQRTLFEKILLTAFSASSKNCLLIRGKPGTTTGSAYGKVTVLPSATDDEICELLHPQTILVCRPGYSTIMDLAVLQHEKTVFVPTPGQTEQLYLAGELHRRYGYSIVQQGDPIPMENIPAGKPVVTRPELFNRMLQDAVADLLNRN